MKLIGGFVEKSTSSVAQFVVKQFDDMKMIEHNGRLGQVLNHGGKEGGRHVDGDCFHFGS